MSHASFFFSSVILALSLAGCSQGKRSPLGFRLPDGDPSRGKQAFSDLKCVSCHSVTGVSFGTNEYIGSLNVPLGGETLRVQTYGGLVTSIINPSHIVELKYKQWVDQDSKLSPMPEFNKVMTVEQMIDLVAFLQPRYHLPAPEVVLSK